MTLELQGVGLRVGGETHLADVDLSLRPGTLTVLLGPTRAGKTTLMRVMAGLDRPSVGRVLEGGGDVTGASVRRRNVAFVYQQFINYPSFTVRDNIAAPLKRAGVPRAEVRRRVEETAAALRIEHLLDRLPAELSGGQQQRTALARALVKDARLLLLDEPLVNLDYKLREELRAELRAIFARRDAIVVYASTEPTEALLLGGNVVVLDEGRVLQHGPTLGVFHRPASARVGAVFSDPPMNMVAGEIAAGALLLGDARGAAAAHLANLPAGRYRFGVRPNHVSIHRAHDGDIAFDGVVELAEVNGSETFIHAEHGGVSWVAQDEGVHGFRIGEPVRLYVDARRVYAFAPDGTLVAAPG